ncbi:hypothetical protein FRB94_012786 [Tulasnella sp. JGI-2019a]|nr:hypothetical protein FRB94_012786 [Tulasnella sp. JGI-2019a]
MSNQDYYNQGGQQQYGQQQYGQPQQGYYPPPGGPPQQGGYYPNQPQQAYQGGGPPQGQYYQPQPGPQPVYVQQPQQKAGGAGGGLMACLAGVRSISTMTTLISVTELKDLFLTGLFMLLCRRLVSRLPLLEESVGRIVSLPQVPHT